MAANDLYTLAHLSDQVCLNIGDTSDITQAKAKKYINRALLFFAECGDWPWQRIYNQSFSTVASTEEYEIAGVKEITCVFLNSPLQRKLRKLEDREFRAMYPNNTATGTPYFYRDLGWSTTTVDTKKIGLYPIPDSVATIKYDAVRAIQELTSDTQDVRLITGMPKHLINLLIEIATTLGWKEMDDQDDRANLEEVLVRLKAVYNQSMNSIEDVHIMAPLQGADINATFDPILDPRFS